MNRPTPFGQNRNTNRPRTTAIHQVNATTSPSIGGNPRPGGRPPMRQNSGGPSRFNSQRPGSDMAPKEGSSGNRPRQGRMSRPMRRPNLKGTESPYRHSISQQSQREVAETTIPPVAPGNIRIIPLGGVEEIGMNMTAVEIGNDILVIDAGFAFTDEDTPGIDYSLPNTKYLEDRKDRIRGMIITHGHLDHIGGLPFVIDKIGNPPIYTRNLTALMLKKRMSEFPHIPACDYKILEQESQIKIGEMSIKFFGVTHSIPDSLGIAIQTPYGYIVSPGDFKLDHTDGVPTPAEDAQYKMFDGKNALMLLADSTNVENPGFSVPERLVHDGLDEIIKNTHGRLFIAAFASHVLRLTHIIKTCEKYGKKVIVEGRSIKNNVEILNLAGLLTVNKGTIIAPQDAENYPPDKIVVLATGAQGEEFSLLDRLANGTYKFLKLNDRDTILLSASIVPGNEKSVAKLKDSLARGGARIIHYRTSEVYVHSTGHGNRGELEWLHRRVNAKFFMPIHGSHYHLKVHGELAQNLGTPKDHIIIPDNGTIVEIQDNGSKIVKLPVKAQSNRIMVDGFTIGDVQDVVIRDRQILSQDGIFVVIGLINAATGKLKKSPDIISRGSVYLRESQDLLRDTRNLIKNTVEQITTGMHPINVDYVKEAVSDTLSRFIFQKTAKRPIVIPVIICI